MPNISKTIVNFWLDTLLLVLFVTYCWSSVVLHFVFPPGTQALGWTLWGRDYVWWRDVQFGILCVLALAILIHVMLHWSWVCGVVSSRFARKKEGAAARDDGSRTLWGVGLLILVVNLVGLGIAVAALTIQSPSAGL